MKEVDIIEDVRKYEKKVFFGFSLRQAISLGISGILCATIKFALNIPSSIETLVLLLAVVIPIAFGFINPYDMKMEKFLKDYFIHNVLPPANRKYITKNIYEELVPKSTITKKDIKQAKKRALKIRKDNSDLQGYL